MPTGDQPCRRLAQHETGDLYFRHQRRDASLIPGAMSYIAPASFAATG